MKGPTMRRLTWGSARRTAKWPTSTLRGTITRSMASAARASPGAGSLAGKKLMTISPLPMADAPPGRCRSGGAGSGDVERLGAGRLAGGIEPDLLHPSLGLAQQLLAAALERLAALVDGNRLLERHLALLEPLDDRFELLDRPFEGQALDVGMGGVGHGRVPVCRALYSVIRIWRNRGPSAPRGRDQPCPRADAGTAARVASPVRS